jgi:outer membrane protein assembly factor BamB
LGESSPAIDSNAIIYVGSSDDNLYAVFPNGTLDWRFTTGGPIQSSPSIGEDGTIYVGSDDNNLYALTQEGQLKWKFATGGWVVSSPAIDSRGIIYVGSYDGFLYAVHPSGLLKWKFDVGAAISSSPTLSPRHGTIYVTSELDVTGATYLHAVNRNGQLDWKLQLLPPWPAGGHRYCDTSNFSSSPAIGSHGIIYTTNGCGSLVAVNPRGMLVWQIDTFGFSVLAAAIGSDGSIYTGSGGGMVALNTDGTTKWACGVSTCGEPGRSSSTLGPDGTIYIGTSISSAKGQLHGILLAID